MSTVREGSKNSGLLEVWALQGMRSIVFFFAVVNFGSRSERAEHRPAGSWSAHPHEETVAKS